ncbi:Mitochondrial carrier [Balamuthia mandrillaris]
MKEAFVTIFREEGLWGFFKGLPPRLMYITPAAAVSFMFYEQFKMLLKSHKNRNSGRTTKSQSAQEAYILKHPAVPVIAGGLARLLGTACRTPFDILRQRLQVQGSIKNSAYKGLGTFGSLRLLIKTEGWRGLWTGYSIAVLRDVPFAAIYFLSYELLKEQQIFRFKAEKERLAIYNHLLAGAGAGAVAATCTNPFDVVKTRLQTQSTLPLEERNKYNGGIVATLRSIVKEEGAAGLTQGLKPRLLYLTPAASLTFASYEQYKRLLGIE